MQNVMFRFQQIYPTHSSIINNKRHKISVTQGRRSGERAPNICKDTNKRNMPFIEAYFERYTMIFSINGSHYKLETEF